MNSGAEHQNMSPNVWEKEKGAIVQKIEIRGNTLHCKGGISGFHLRPAMSLSSYIQLTYGYITINGSRGKQCVLDQRGGSANMLITVGRLDGEDFTIICRSAQEAQQLKEYLIGLENQIGLSVPDRIKALLG